MSVSWIKPLGHSQYAIRTPVGESHIRLKNRIDDIIPPTWEIDFGTGRDRWDLILRRTPDFRMEYQRGRKAKTPVVWSAA